MKSADARSPGPILRRWSATLLLGALLALAAPSIVRKHVVRAADGAVAVTSDVLVYVDAARDLLAGRDLYATAPGEFPYVYPPFYALLNIPLVFVHPLAVDIAWYLLNVAALCAVLHLTYRLATGRPFTALPAREQWLLAGLAILFASRYLVRNAVQANVNLAIVWLALLGFARAARTGNPRWAGLIGVAAAIKVLPVVLLVPIAARRRWRQLVWAAGACVAATFLPALFFGFGRTGESLRSFLGYLGRRMSADGVVVENFSFWGVLGRLLSRQVAFDAPDGSPVYVNLADLDLGLVKLLVQAVGIALVALLFLISRRTRDDGDDSPRVDAGAIVAGLLTMNLAAALVEEHHTVTYLPAFLYLLIAWRSGAAKGRWFVAGLFGTGIASNLLVHDLVVPALGRHAYMTLLAWGVPVLPAGLVLLGMALHVMERARATPAAARRSPRSSSTS